MNEKKSEYKGALASLERISEEVHNKRKLRMIECNPESDTESDRSSSLGKLETLFTNLQTRTYNTPGKIIRTFEMQLYEVILYPVQVYSN